MMYAPLKVTTDYSLLKSLIKVEDLINFLHEFNIPAAGVVDDNLSSSIEFYNLALKNNIKPIIGLSLKINALEIYLYALNFKGYQNLIKLNNIKDERELAIIDIENYKDNLACIIPYQSKELFKPLSFIKDLYLGYKTLYEKNNALLITKNILYVNDLKALNMADLKYLKYLDLLAKRNEEEYTDNYYQKEDFIDVNKINDFISLFNLEIPSKQRYIPTYTTNSSIYLEALAKKGLEKRLNGVNNPKYLERLNYELRIIKKMGYVDYFLIVYDYVLYAKKSNIMVGCRGSAAGSLVSYSLGITDIDPLEYNLLFERFLNPERVSMPDIDIDFDAYKREEVIKYVQEKYGKEHVALGLTFATLKSKLVLREMGKILRINSLLLDKFLKEINGNANLKDNLKNIRIKKYLETYPELKNLYQVSLKLEGLKKNTSIHAAGVVISSIAIDEVIPLIKNTNIFITGIPMDYLEDLGFLKMDFLALKNLTSISNILKRIPNLNINKISLEEKEVYELFQKGKTEGIFQFETPAMQEIIQNLKPTCFADLTAAVALGRPGPKNHIQEFIRRKNGLEKITYLHPDLVPILKETYGIILYQEQVIAILGQIGGFSYASADVIRRAISKKKESIILKSADEFLKGAIKRGYPKELAQEIYAQIVKFADYGFNKSHSVSYAYLAYKQAYLKTFYAPYFVLELLNTEKGPKSLSYLNYLKQKGYKLVKPSINNNSLDYEIEDDKLIMPLTSIKNINLSLATEIYQNKKEGYTDYFDFVLKNKELNKEIINVLIASGALDLFNLNHETLRQNMDSALNYAALAAINVSLVKKPTIKEYEEKKDPWTEAELYGFYMTNHPASFYHEASIIKIINLNKYLFKKGNFICLIESIKEITTKKGDKMAFIKASDETGITDFTVFPKVYANLKDLKEKDLVKINGEVGKRFDKVNVIVNNISKVGQNE